MNDVDEPQGPGEGDEPPPEPPPAAGPPQPPPAATSSEPYDTIRRPRPRRPPGVSTGFGAANDGAWAPWQNQNRDARELWNEIRDRMDQYPNELGTPYDWEIRGRRVAPTSHPFQSIPGDAVQGFNNQSPGDQLLEFVTDNWHLPTARSKAIYDLTFALKRGGRYQVVGRLELPSPDDIMAVRQAGYYRQSPQRPYAPPPPYYGAGPGPGYGPPQGYGAPGYAPGGPAQGGGSYGPATSPREDALLRELQMMRSELARQQGALQEALSAAREGRHPNLAGAAAAAPPAPASTTGPAAAGSMEELATRLAGILTPTLVDVVGKTFGLKPPAAANTNATAAGVGAAATQAETMAQGLGREILQFCFNEAQKTIRTGFRTMSSGAGSPAEPEPGPEPIMAEPVPAKPEDSLPFESMPIGDAKWSDGRPVIYTRDRETGDTDWAAGFWANPFVAERVMEAGTKFVEGVQGAISKWAGIKTAGEAAAQVVSSNIPRGAVDGTVAGAPSRPASAPQPTVTPPPAANGQAGWPQG